MSDSEFFTVVFAGDLRKLGKNPFKIVSDFGEAVSVAFGNALEELDAHRDESAKAIPPADRGGAA
jgi:hypothetical protein